MKWLWDCRRTFIATLGMLACVALGLVNHTDVTGSIASIAIGLAAANAGEGIYRKRKDAPDASPPAAS